MLQIDNAIISLDVLDKKFCCNLQKCKGDCCVHGDSGAPLEENELEIIENIYPLIKPYLTKEGDAAIQAIGCYTIDSDGDYVTPLVNNMECAYVYYENGIVKCSIEKAYNEGIINFIKPISCHLYPIRIKKYTEFDAVNYDRNDLCKSAVRMGNKESIPIYVFLKEPLIRKYGKEWYEQLKYAGDNRNDITKK